MRGVGATIASVWTWMGVFSLLAACGESSHGSNPSASSGGSSGSSGRSNSGGTANSSTGGSVSAGSAGRGGTGAAGGAGGDGARGGSGGIDGEGGDADTGGAGTGGTSGGTSGSGGSGGTSGSGEEGGAGGSDPCAGISECDAAGTSCDDGTLVTCAPDNLGCLVEERTDCSPQPCEDTGTAACASHGDSCDTPLVVSAPVVLSGSDFVADYTSTFTLAGVGCAGYGSGREMVLRVDLQAGEAVAVRQFGGVQTALNIASGCAPDAACLTATDALYGNQEIGIHYRATVPVTVFIIVDLIGAASIWDYNVFVEFPESLGVLAAADPIPDLVLSANDGSRRDMRLIEFTEAVQLSGTIDVGGDPSYLYFSLVDAAANVVASFEAMGDDTFGPFAVPAGEYRVVTTGWNPDPVTISLSTL